MKNRMQNEGKKRVGEGMKTFCQDRWPEVSRLVGQYSLSLSLSLSPAFFSWYEKKLFLPPFLPFFPPAVVFFFFFFNAAKRNALAVHERRKLNEPGEFFAGFDPRPFRWKSSCQQLSAPLRAFVYPGSVAANGETRIMKSRAIDVAVKMLFFVGRWRTTLDASERKIYSVVLVSFARKRNNIFDSSHANSETLRLTWLRN